MSDLDRPTVKLLRRMGWEPDLWDRKGIRKWLRPHPNDIASYPTRTALWLALTGRSRRGGWNAKGWRRPDA